MPPLRYCSASPVEFGRELLRCSRCKSTWYKTKEAQRNHWPLHKKTCKKWTSDDEQQLNAITSVQVLWKLIRSDLPKGSHATARRLQRLRHIMDQQLDADDEDGMDFGDGKQDSENAAMHGDVRHLIFMNWNTERL